MCINIYNYINHINYIIFLKVVLFILKFRFLFYNSIVGIVFKMLLSRIFNNTDIVINLKSQFSSFSLPTRLLDNCVKLILEKSTPPRAYFRQKNQRCNIKDHHLLTSKTLFFFNLYLAGEIFTLNNKNSNGIFILI